MTKREEKEMINNTKWWIQKKMKELNGYAPALKDIRPLEYSSNYETKYEMHIISFMGFDVNGIGYEYRNGIVEKSEAYNMK